MIFVLYLCSDTFSSLSRPRSWNVVVARLYHFSSTRSRSPIPPNGDVAVNLFCLLGVFSGLFRLGFHDFPPFRGASSRLCSLAV